MFGGKLKFIGVPTAKTAILRFGKAVDTVYYIIVNAHAECCMAWSRV